MRRDRFSSTSLSPAASADSGAFRSVEFIPVSNAKNAAVLWGLGRRDICLFAPASSGLQFARESPSLELGETVAVSRSLARLEIAGSRFHATCRTPSLNEPWRKNNSNSEKGIWGVPRQLRKRPINGRCDFLGELRQASRGRFEIPRSKRRNFPLPAPR